MKEGHVRKGHVREGYVKKGHVREGHVRKRQVREGHLMGISYELALRLKFTLKFETHIIFFYTSMQPMHHYRSLSTS